MPPFAGVDPAQLGPVRDHAAWEFSVVEPEVAYPRGKRWGRQLNHVGFHVQRSLHRPRVVAGHPDIEMPLARPRLRE